MATTEAETSGTEESTELDTRSYLKGLIEALLFVSDRPLTVKELARASKIDRKRAQELMTELTEDYKPRGLIIEEVAGGFVFRSGAAYSEYVRKFLAQRPVRLSRAQLETLSIVAYRQPITRPQIDDVRGVDSGPVLKGLLERELIRILGKKDEPGRPLLYGTSVKFLELFSLQSLTQLPTLKDFSELTDESKQLFERKTGEEAPEGTVLLPEAEDEASPDTEPDEADDEEPDDDDNDEDDDDEADDEEAEDDDEADDDD